MALFIVYVDRYGKDRERTWYVGKDVPDLPIDNIYEIHADGKEAKYVEEIMAGGINRPVQRYYGDFARTIYLNL